MPLTHTQAQHLIDAAHRQARTLDARITVAIVDEGGHLQALGRMDGAPPLSAEVAEHKATTAALFRRDGAALGALREAAPGFFGQLGHAVDRPLLIGAGTLLIRGDNTVLGAVSVSGGNRPHQDDECAEAALAALTSPR